MKNLFKLSLVIVGFALATIASSNDVKANSNSTKNVIQPISDYGGCYGDGDCGTTRNGTRLNGKWREL